MTHLGPYRKGKKAFKLGRKNREAGRYQLLLGRIEKRRKQAGKMVLAAMSAALGASQIAMIRQMPIDRHDPHSRSQRSLAIANSIIHTALQVQRILNQS